MTTKRSLNQPPRKTTTPHLSVSQTLAAYCCSHPHRVIGIVTELSELASTLRRERDDARKQLAAIELDYPLLPWTPNGQSSIGPE